MHGLQANNNGLQANNNSVRHITNQTLIFNFLLIVK